MFLWSHPQGGPKGKLRQRRCHMASPGGSLAPYLLRGKSVYMGELNRTLCIVRPGISQFLTEGIVRVGGRINSEAMKQFSLTTLRNSRDMRKNIPGHLRATFAVVLKLIKQFSDPSLICFIWLQIVCCLFFFYYALPFFM